MFYEIGYDGVIRDNPTKENGYSGSDAGLYLANILVLTSGSSAGSTRGFQVYGSSVAGGANGKASSSGTVPTAPLVRAPTSPESSTSATCRRHERGRHRGVDTTRTALFTSRTNRFEGNTYHLPYPTLRAFGGSGE
jgi:hypothetical protein